MGLHVFYAFVEYNLISINGITKIQYLLLSITLIYSTMCLSSLFSEVALHPECGARLIRTGFGPRSSFGSFYGVELHPSGIPTILTLWKV
jgi:hypothetical protein